MNNESLHINPSSLSEWTITYVGWAECPEQDWRNITGQGQTEIGVRTDVGNATSLAGAVNYAREWAVGSGFKVGSPRFDWQNRLILRLRRP